MDPLDGCHAAEHAVAGMIRHGEQQPWDCSSIGRIDLGGHLAANFAAIIVLPRWSAKMFTHNISLFVIEQRFGSFERPGRLTGGIGAANIDLKTFGMSDEQKLFTGRSFDQVRNLGELHAKIVASELCAAIELEIW